MTCTHTCCKFFDALCPLTTGLHSCIMLTLREGIIHYTTLWPLTLKSLLNSCYQYKNFWIMSCCKGTQKLYTFAHVLRIHWQTVPLVAIIKALSEIKADGFFIKESVFTGGAYRSIKKTESIASSFLLCLLAACEPPPTGEFHQCWPEALGGTGVPLIPG